MATLPLLGGPWAGQAWPSPLRFYIFPSFTQRSMPNVKIQRQLPINDENDKWDLRCYQRKQGECCASSSRVDQKMRHRAAAAMAVTDDKPGHRTLPFSQTIISLLDPI